MEKIDLHIHSNLSDGVLNAEDIVKKALSNNCKTISITDHDDIDTYKDLEDKYGIRIIPGIEFNSSIRNMHILGYGMTDISQIKKVTTDMRLFNEKVSYEVVEKMMEDGFDISIEKIITYINSLGLNCDILDKRKIVKYLIHKRYANNVIDAYNKLIGVGRKYYVPNFKLSPKEIIDLINISNGISVLAHPKSLNLDFEKLKKQISILENYGLSGIEIQNRKMNQNDHEYYEQLIQNKNLLKTVGSDFHDPIEDDIGISVNDNIYHNIVKKLVLTRKK